jgi:opacity protein-like surface antigen
LLENVLLLLARDYQNLKFPLYLGSSDMHIKSILKIGISLMAISLSQNSLAESYWGIGAGVTTWNLKPLNGAVELDNGFTLDGLLGLRSGNLAMEGEFTISVNDWQNYSDYYHTASNLIFAGVGFLPLSETIELYGKVGADFWRTTVHYQGSNYDGDNGVAFVVGAGARMKLTESFSLRLEYKQVNGLSDGLDEGNIGQTTLLAVFKIK